MNVQAAIRQRRSIRQYTTAAPNDTDVRKILQAGIWAPSGLNNQPWKFKLVKEKKQTSDLAKFTKCGRIIQNAPMVICVFLNSAASYNREKDIMAIGACIQNMLLAAGELGLAACWLGEILNKHEQVEKCLNIDPDYELMAVITLGYSDEGASKGRRNNLNSSLC